MKYKRKIGKKLNARRRSYEALPKNRGFRRPGSMNPRKQA